MGKEGLSGNGGGHPHILGVMGCVEIAKTRTFDNDYTNYNAVIR